MRQGQRLAFLTSRPGRQRFSLVRVFVPQRSQFPSPKRKPPHSNALTFPPRHGPRHPGRKPLVPCARHPKPRAPVAESKPSPGKTRAVVSATPVRDSLRLAPGSFSPVHALSCLARGFRRPARGFPIPGFARVEALRATCRHPHARHRALHASHSAPHVRLRESHLTLQASRAGPCPARPQPATEEHPRPPPEMARTRGRTPSIRQGPTPTSGHSPPASVRSGCMPALVRARDPAAHSRMTHNVTL